MELKPDFPLSQLIIDYWYKAMLIISFTLFIMACVMDIAVIGNASLMLLSAGGMFVSFGEWINHPLQTHIWVPGAVVHQGAKLTSYNRQPQLLGSLFDILGFILISLGFWQLIKHINLV